MTGLNLWLVWTSVFHINKECFIEETKPAWNRSVNRHLETGVNMIALLYRIILNAFKKEVIGTKHKDDV